MASSSSIRHKWPRPTSSSGSSDSLKQDEQPRRSELSQEPRKLPPSCGPSSAQLELLGIRHQRDSTIAVARKRNRLKLPRRNLDKAQVQPRTLITTKCNSSLWRQTHLRSKMASAGLRARARMIGRHHSSRSVTLYGRFTLKLVNPSYASAEICGAGFRAKGLGFLGLGL